MKPAAPSSLALCVTSAQLGPHCQTLIGTTSANRHCHEEACAGATPAQRSCACQHSGGWVQACSCAKMTGAKSPNLTQHLIAATQVKAFNAPQGPMCP